MDDAQRARVRSGLRHWFRTQPRRHGEVEYRREVSFLELFYDLVYVVAIGQASHHLAEHLDWEGLRDFTIVIALIWFAWFNGTFWHEMHGRQNGRSRSYIFAQMALIALLAVFTGNATGADGAAFAWTYAVLFVLFTWQWYTVQRIDTDPRYRPLTTRYISAMAITVVTISISALTSDTTRVAIWAVVSLAWLVVGFRMISTGESNGVTGGFTASLVERFGLFVIIVLGEVVLGVVNGMIDAPERDALTILTGMVSLSIGMGLWWTYFDLLGRRIPSQHGYRLGGWLFAHLPLAASIAASGAAMVRLVEHAGDARTPTTTAWILAMSVSVSLASITVATSALSGDALPVGMQRQIAIVSGVASTGIVLVAALTPRPLVLVATISLLLGASWFRLFVVYLALGGRLPEEDSELAS